MMELSCGKRNLTKRLAILIQSTCVTHRQTDRQTDTQSDRRKWHGMC